MAALAPRMPVTTEDVVQANGVRKCDSTAKVYTSKNISCLNDEKENPGWNQIEWTSNSFFHQAHDGEHQQLLLQQHRYGAAPTATAAHLGLQIHARNI